MSTEKRQLLRRYSFIKKLSGKIYYLATFVLRDGNAKLELKKKKKGPLNVRSLTDTENKEVRRMWGNHVKGEWFSFYNAVKREKNLGFDARYVPQNIQYCFIDDWFCNSREAYALDDKNMYDMYFHDVIQPKTIVRKVNGLYLDENYKELSLEQVVEKCKKQNSVIIKPSVNMGAGNGIVFWNETDGEILLLESLNQKSNCVVQEIIRQHSALADLHKESVNTIRMITCFLDGEMRVLSTIVRMGAGASRLDNASAGGLFCGVQEDGRLKKYGYNKGGESFEKHPQGGVFAECKIPNFERCKNLVKMLAYRFVRVSRLISWDLAIAEDGEPLLIEVNLCYGDVDIHQMANGPLYGEYTEQIIRQVLNVKKYRRYKHWL
ncbi:MAG: hypothetical protein IKG81_08735 [Bacteroidales bacterium]|nr:hypothetical protein [Bacteroidales bacterium]